LSSREAATGEPAAGDPLHGSPAARLLRVVGDVANEATTAEDVAAVGRSVFVVWKSSVFMSHSLTEWEGADTMDRFGYHFPEPDQLAAEVLETSVALPATKREYRRTASESITRRRSAAASTHKLYSHRGRRTPTDDRTSKAADGRRWRGRALKRLLRSRLRTADASGSRLAVLPLWYPVLCPP
jgi:hypothetical protein